MLVVSSMLIDKYERLERVSESRGNYPAELDVCPLPGRSVAGIAVYERALG